MSEPEFFIAVDGARVPARKGQTILEACDQAGVYIPRLCHHPDLPPAGHCRVCTCKINGRHGSTCNTPATPGMSVENDTPELNKDRRALIELLFIEGNHVCQACEQSGSCELQALAYRLGLEAPQLPYQWPERPVDASHPDLYLDRNRCILCGRCARASREVDGKGVFGMEGRGIHLSLAVDSQSGLGATDIAATDKAASVCPVGSLVKKRGAFRVPYGQRPFDSAPIGSDIEAKRTTEGG